MDTTKQIPLLDLQKQMEPLKTELLSALEKMLEQTDFVSGAAVASFERDFAVFLNAKHAISCANGTDAIYLALKAMNIQPGDGVIVPSMSFVATAEPIITLGAAPLFCDVDESTEVLTGAILQNALEKAHELNISIKGVVPVHLRGNACPMDEIMMHAKKHNLIVIEDAAQAHGTKYNNRCVGTFGHVATFSFYPGKNLGALGDGGALTTDREEIANSLRQFKDHGRVSKYEHALVGINSRLDTIQAAWLQIKLKHLAQWNAQRRIIAGWYNDLLANLSDLTLPTETKNSYHTYHHYAVRVSRRDALSQHLKDHGIASVVHYPKAIHEQPAFRSYKQLGKLTVSEQIAATTLSLPIYPELTRSQVEYICDTVRSFLQTST